MGESFIESVPTPELHRLAEQAATGGEYEAARGLLQRELARRAALVEAMHTVDMPVADPIDYLVPVDPMDFINSDTECCQ